MNLHEGAATAPSAEPVASASKRIRKLVVLVPLLATEHCGKWLAGWMARYGLVVSRVALGVIFLWFGLIKFLPSVAPIDLLAERTLMMLTFHLFQPSTTLHVLAGGECLIGLGLLTNRFLPLTVAMLFLQMIGTFSPLILLHKETWIHFPYMPSFEGQYIIKNIVLISSGIIVGSTARGGKIIANPEVAAKAERVEIQVEESALRKLEADTFQ